MAWRAMDPLSAISSDSGSDSGSDSEEGSSGKMEKAAAAAAGERKRVAEPDFDALSRHGYAGGPSVLHVPAPRQAAEDPNWAWSNGKRKRGEAGAEEAEVEESPEERERTRERANVSAARMAAEALAESAHARKQKKDAAAEQKALSFSQKEKRKRDLGQASRGKNYVEEEKRLLRDSGVYSGFDT